MEIQGLAVAATSGFVAGYLTNKLALKLLFWPPRPWGPFPAGVFPSRQSEMAAEVGRTVAGQVLTAESLRAHITSPELQGRIHDEIRGAVDGVLFRRYRTLDDALALVVPTEQERDELAARGGALLGGWIAAVLAGDTNRAAVAEGLEAALTKAADRRLDELLPVEAQEALRRLIRRLVRVAAAQAPEQVIEGYRAWLADPRPLGYWFGRPGGDGFDALAQRLATEAAELVQELARDQGLIDRAVGLCERAVDAALAPQGKGIVPDLRASLLRLGWSAVGDDALKRLREQLPALVAELAQLVSSPENSARLSNWLQRRVDEFMRSPVRDLWASVPGPVQETLFGLLDDLLRQPALWDLIERQVDGAVAAIYERTLDGVLPPAALSAGSVVPPGGEVRMLSHPPLVVFLAGPGSAAPIRAYLGLAPDEDVAAFGLDEDWSAADLPGRPGQTRSFSPFRASWAGAVLVGDQDMEQLVRFADRAAAFVVAADAISGPGAWLHAQAAQFLLGAKGSTLVLSGGPPSGAEIRGEVRGAAADSAEELLGRKVQGDGAGAPEFLTLELGLMHLLGGEIRSSAALASLPEGMASTTREAVEQGRWRRLRGLSGASALDGWLRRIARASAAARSVAADSDRPADQGQPNEQRPSARLDAVRAMVDAVASTIGEVDAERLGRTVVTRLRALSVGVPASHLDAQDAAALGQRVADRVFNVLETNAARVAASVDVAGLARQRVEELDPADVEAAVGRMSMGAFWVLEVLGGVFGLLATLGFAWLYQWNEVVGLVGAGGTALVAFASLLGLGGRRPGAQLDEG